MILNAQHWLTDNCSVRRPVDAMTQMAGMSSRTFERRFKDATCYNPINYVARIRIEEGKRRLEQTDRPIEGIS